MNWKYSIGVTLVSFGTLFTIITALNIWNEYAWVEPHLRESYKLYPEEVPKIIDAFMKDAFMFFTLSLLLLVVGFSLLLIYDKKRKMRY